MRDLLLILTGTLAYTTLMAQADTMPCRDPHKHVIQTPALKSTYENCKRNGMTWWYNDKGKIKSKVNFKDGREEGIYTSYHDNGKVKLTVPYVNGQKHGTQKMYYDNGKLGSKVNYVNGKREGLMTEWAYEGYKSSEVLYKRNYKVGLKKYYDKEGKIRFTEEYKMDRNPVIAKLLKDKRKEVDVDLAKYGLIPPQKEAKK
jgi:antitoxin component YwqK of YwqJK toxin-antitoxin module